MKMKAILFDLDGVIVKSSERKRQILQEVLQKYDLYTITGVIEILEGGFNRRVKLEKIYELSPSFDVDEVYEEITQENAILETNPTANDTVVDFIKSHYKDYVIGIITSQIQSGLNRVIKSLRMEKYFKEVLSFSTGTKSENIMYVLRKYGLDPNEVLFVDDNINHIYRVSETGVHTLHFTDYDIDLEKEIEKY